MCMYIPNRKRNIVTVLNGRQFSKLIRYVCILELYFGKTEESPEASDGKGRFQIMILKIQITKLEFLQHNLIDTNETA